MLSRAPLANERFDVIVIGGGINGVAIARECARSRASVLLLERHDFAAGTTSRATRIIHGGLRYLEHGELTLVRESLRERQRLLADEPHLVHHLNFVLALPQGGARRSALEIRFALWLYRRLAGGSVAGRNCRQEISELLRQLDKGERWALFNYDDAQCEFPERLVAEWLMDATADGAVVRNHTSVVAVEVAHGRAHGVVARDELTGKEFRVAGRWIVNATGPWADRVAAASDVDTGTPMIGGVRGTHLVVRKFVGAPESAVYTEAVDGRPIFLVPWNGQLLFGTTEVRDDADPANVAPSEVEVDYLAASLQRLFPAAALEMRDVRYAFAGVRPLPFTGSRDPEMLARVTRRHHLRDHAHDGAANFVSVIGGKLTTAAALARDCARHIGLKVAGPKPPVLTTASGSDVAGVLREWSQQTAQRCGIPVESAGAIAEWQGRRALCVAKLAASDEALRATLCPHTHHVVAEAVNAFDAEYAVTLGDVLLRRVPVALGACWSEECSRVAAARIGAVMRWSDYEIARRLREFEHERAGFLRAAALSRVPTERAG